MDRLEQLCRSLAYVATPILLAALGSCVNANLQNQSVSQKYVEIAISILQKPLDPGQSAEEQGGLRNWAIDLLTDSSPITLTQELKDAFVKGDVRLPATSLGTTEVPIDLTIRPVVSSAYVKWDEESYFRGLNFGADIGQVFARVRVYYFDLVQFSVNFVPISDESIKSWNDTEVVLVFASVDKERLRNLGNLAAQDMSAERASGYHIDYVIITASGAQVISSARRGARHTGG